MVGEVTRMYQVPATRNTSSNSKPHPRHDVLYICVLYAQSNEQSHALRV